MNHSKNGGFMPIVILFLLGLVVFVLVELASGGAKKDGVLSFLQPSWMNTSTMGSKASVSVKPSGSEKPNEPEAPKPVPPAGYSLSDLSPYYKKVRLGSVRPPSDSFALDASFSLSGDQALGTKGAVVTGWVVQTNRGRQTMIPKAIEDYNLLSPVSETPMTLRAGQTAYFYGWANKQKTPNLLLHKCTGYLNNTFKFSPELPNECPRIESSNLPLLSGACQNFIRSLGACRVPTAAELNQFTSPNEGECRATLDRQNFGTCYREHRADADFFSREWRVWLGEFIPFDRQHDRLLLLDGERLIVDEYVY